MPPSNPDTIVVGGGLAGIAAAVSLADAGLRVLLLEQTRRLGGRASSFIDQATSEELDNCQHVVMGCCTNYRNLISRLGADQMFRWDTEQHWVSEGGHTDRIAPSHLPAPLHHAPSFQAARFLSADDKLAIAHATSALTSAAAVRSETASISFAQWLHDHWQPATTINRFWRPVIVSACNAQAEHTAANLAIKVFRDGLLASAEASAIGVPIAPLNQLYAAVPDVIEASGGSVEFGAHAVRITPTSVTLRDGRTLYTKAVIVALPFERVASAIHPNHHDDRVAALSAITHSPILGVHLDLVSPLTKLPHAVLVERDTQWVFRKNDSGSKIHAVISAADAWLDLTEPEIASRVVADLQACFPDAGPIGVTRAKAVKSRRATFLPRPGIHAARPPVAPSRPDALILAGDYTDTAWPATMEGAVRSGRMAAATVLNLQPGAMLTPDLSPGRLARFALRS